MRYLVVLLGFFLCFPVQSFAQNECSSYDENGNCADGLAPTEEGGMGSGGYQGPVITENTPVIGQLAVGCFKLLSRQSSLIQWACEQAADAAYQECLDENDGYDTTGPNGFSICGSAHTRALENCAAIPEVLDSLVTVCTEDDKTTLQLYPF